MKISAKTLNNNSSDPELAGGWGGQTEKSKMRLSRMIFPLYLLPRVGRPLLVAGGEEPLHVLGGAGVARTGAWAWSTLNKAELGTRLVLLKLEENRVKIV